MGPEVIARAHQELMEMAGFLRAANVQLDKAEAHITYWMPDSPLNEHLNKIQELIFRVVISTENEAAKLLEELN